MGARFAAIHKDQTGMWFRAAWAPLASTKAETMKRMSPAPAIASLIHMTTISLSQGFVLVSFHVKRKNKP